ncbi:unnamed protein product [Lathyrus sativus]|nr:unnamed protein product [Lathyrus sativus]
MELIANFFSCCAKDGDQKPTLFTSPRGECTLTLEDVHMLLGLRVDGSAVVGDTNVNYALVEELLGVPLERGDRKGQSIKITWLKRNYSALNLTNESPEEHKLYKTRMYLLLLFACFLFPDTNGNTIHLQYLPLLEDLNEVSRYSWGVSTLAHLYRNLCRCEMKNVHNFAGCGVLIQAGDGPECSDCRRATPIHITFHTQPSGLRMG